MLTLGASLAGCNFGDKELSMQMTAFNELTKEEKDLILVSPKDSTVEKITVNDEIKGYINNYEENQIYSVTFNNIEHSGELIVYVSLDKKIVVGKKFINDNS